MPGFKTPGEGLPYYARANHMCSRCHFCWLNSYTQDPPSSWSEPTSTGFKSIGLNTRRLKPPAWLLYFIWTLMQIHTYTHTHTRTHTHNHTHTHAHAHTHTASPHWMVCRPISMSLALEEDPHERADYEGEKKCSCLDFNGGPWGY